MAIMERDNVGRFAQGWHGGPGRPAGYAAVARRILAETHDGDDLVAWALAVWRDPKRTHAERAAMHAWLADRALGRPVQAIAASVLTEQASELPDNFDELPDAERERIVNAIVPALPAGRP